MSNSIHWLNFIQTISDIGSYLAEKISFLYDRTQEGGLM